MKSFTIWVKTQFVGFHRWVDASKEKHAYLQKDHRHLFKVRVELNVDYTDREVEFHDLLHDVNVIVKERYEEQVTNLSCEDMAGEIMDALEGMLKGYRVHSVSVSEDGECGATVTSEANR